MARATPISPKQMQARGWTRVDPKPWTKLRARWVHPSGWRLIHCGHPTALHPWALYNPAGRMIRAGAAGPARNPDFGAAWDSLELASAYVATVTPASIPVRAGRCRVCGCVDKRACPEGCAWVDAKHTLCSACAHVPEGVFA